MRKLALLVLLAVCWAGLQVEAQEAGKGQVWVGSWATSQQIPEPWNSLPSSDMTDMTMREIFHLSVGGQTVRVRLSNAFGRKPLRFTSVHIARAVSAASSAIDPATDRRLTFAGSADVTVPAGAEYLSDPVELPVAPLSNVAVTFHLDTAPAGETGHPGSRETTYYEHGDHVAAASLPDAKRVDHWFEVSGVDVAAPRGAAAVVVLGDSITDGHASTTNGNDRWTDVLAERLQANAATRDIGVLNEGIGGNHLLTDGLGPNALARLNRDVLAQAGVRWLIVFEGVNDLGKLSREGDVPAAEHALLVHQIEAALGQIVTRAHAEGIRVIGATITPYVGSDYYHPGAQNEADREAVNKWIRTPGHFDSVLDLDKAMRDPAHKDRLRPGYDSGDHLHPGPKGYRAMGDAVPLDLFKGNW
ncbi:MAG TPA: SGNH/GDSL hydrolase family protein [Acidobacteriaceae bacterium]|nr:SGNH/GDSL hydrolase family protein [Acidobacteriaceae bacterium]